MHNHFRLPHDVPRIIYEHRRHGLHLLDHVRVPIESENHTDWRLPDGIVELDLRREAVLRCQVITLTTLLLRSRDNRHPTFSRAQVPWGRNRRRCGSLLQELRGRVKSRPIDFDGRRRWKGSRRHGSLRMKRQHKIETWHKKMILIQSSIRDLPVPESTSRPRQCSRVLGAHGPGH